MTEKGSNSVTASNEPIEAPKSSRLLPTTPDLCLKIIIIIIHLNYYLCVFLCFVIIQEEIKKCCLSQIIKVNEEKTKVEEELIKSRTFVTKLQHENDALKMEISTHLNEISLLQKVITSIIICVCMLNNY